MPQNGFVMVPLTITEDSWACKCTCTRISKKLAALISAIYYDDSRKCTQFADTATSSSPLFKCVLKNSTSNARCSHTCTLVEPIGLYHIEKAAACVPSRRNKASRVVLSSGRNTTEGLRVPSRRSRRGTCQTKPKRAD